MPNADARSCNFSSIQRFKQILCPFEGPSDPTDLHSAIKASCDAGEMINSGYILWYLRPELQGESKQNVDEPSDGPESPKGSFSNG